MLAKMFKEVYGAELSMLISKMEDCLRAYPGELTVSDSGETDSVIHQRAE